MPEEYDSAAWAALAAAGFAGLLVLLVLALLLRWRRAATRTAEALQASSSRTEALLLELQSALERVSASGEPDEEATGAWTPLDLDAALQRALRAATDVLGADAALIVIPDADDQPVVAGFGLAPHESPEELIGLPPDGGGARAVRLDYVYGEELRQHELRVTAGLAVPLVGGEGERVGTLAAFWRGREVALDEGALARGEEVARGFGPALENARRYAEARRLADRDLVTGLQNARSFHERLLREAMRARRYERALALVLFDLTGTDTPYDLSQAGERIRGVIRATDVASHLGEGTFAVILPESGQGEAERLLRRLQFAVGARVDSPSDRLRLLAAILELTPGDDARSLYGRAEELLRRAAGGPYRARGTANTG
jgi:GGDEF domain-containing protein